MKKLKLIVLGLVVLLTVFTFIPQAQAHPEDNFTTIQKVKNLISKALEPVLERVGVVETKVQDLTLKVETLDRPPCATCSAEIREDVVKITNEEEAINSLRSIYLAQELFAKEDTDGNGKYDYAPLMENLFQSGRLIDNVLASGQRRGYNFSLSVDQQQVSWEVVAKPVKPNRTGDRSFFVDETGVIRATEASGSANPNSPPLEN